MYSDWSVFIAIAVMIAFIWLGILTYLVWGEKIFLKKLFPKSGERDVRQKFEEVLKEVDKFGDKLQKLDSRVTENYDQGLLHIQKVKLLRYNPYGDTGGDQSFSLSLLDKKGEGIVITSLHTRAGTRMFAKPVKEGKGGKYELSKEEKQVVEEALK